MDNRSTIIDGKQKVRNLLLTTDKHYSYKRTHTLPSMGNSEFTSIIVHTIVYTSHPSFQADNINHQGNHMSQTEAAELKNSHKPP